jgi:membrane-associated protease RseP (regulator of RpoE activity)
VKKRKLIIGAALVAILIAGGLAGGLALASSDDGDKAAPPAQAQATESDGEAWLGVFVADLNEALAKQLDIENREGAVVLRVVPDSPADKAGVEAKDVITAANGTTVTEPDDLIGAVEGAKPGDKLTLTVARGSETKQIEVTLEESAETTIGAKLRGTLPEAIDKLLPEDWQDLIVGGQITLNEEGQLKTIKALVGEVTDISETSLEVKSADDKTTKFDLTGDTAYLQGLQTISRVDIDKGETVVVVTVNDSKEASIVYEGGLGLGRLSPMERFMPRGQMKNMMPDWQFMPGRGAEQAKGNTT